VNFFYFIAMINAGVINSNTNFRAFGANFTRVPHSYALDFPFNSRFIESLRHYGD